MTSLLLTMFFACGDKETEDTAAPVEDTQQEEQVEDTGSEPEDTATEPEDSGEEEPADTAAEGE